MAGFRVHGRANEGGKFFERLFSLGWPSQVPPPSSEEDANNRYNSSPPPPFSLPICPTLFMAIPRGMCAPHAHLMDALYNGHHPHYCRRPSRSFGGLGDHVSGSGRRRPVSRLPSGHHSRRGSRLRALDRLFCLRHLAHFCSPLVSSERVNVWTKVIGACGGLVWRASGGNVSLIQGGFRLQKS